MTKYILAQWRKHLLLFAIVVFCFTISGLVLAIGIGITVENSRLASDSTSGDLDDQTCLDFRSDDQSYMSMTLLKPLARFGEVQVLNQPSIDINGVKVSPVPVFYEKEEDWHIPLIKGTYIDGYDNSVIIGKLLAEKLNLTEGSVIDVQGQALSVKGIVGRINRTTQWDDTIYMWFDTYNDLFGPFSLAVSDSLPCLIKSGKQELTEQLDLISEEFEEKGFRLYYEPHQPSIRYTSVSNSVYMTLIGFVLVTLIILLNIVNIIYYWFLERRKDLALLKSLGADNKFLFKWLVIEMVTVVSIGELLANVIYLSVWYICGKKLPGDINVAVSPLHFLIALLTSYVTGLFVAWILNRRSIFADPVVTLKSN